MRKTGIQTLEDKIEDWSRVVVVERHQVMDLITFKPHGLLVRVTRHRCLGLMK